MKTKTARDWVKQPTDIGVIRAARPVALGFLMQATLLLLACYIWVAVTMAWPVEDSEQWAPITMLPTVTDRSVDDSAWILPSLLTLVLSSYAIIIAGGFADVGTPIRSIRSKLTFSAQIVAAFAFLWVGLLIPPVVHGTRPPLELIGPIVLSATIAFASALLRGFEFDPPPVRATLLREALTARRDAQKHAHRNLLRPSGAVAEDPKSGYLVKVGFWLIPILLGVGVVVLFAGVTLIFALTFGKIQNILVYSAYLVIFGLILFGWVPAAVWVFLDSIWVRRYSAVCSIRRTWWLSALAVFTWFALVVLPLSTDVWGEEGSIGLAGLIIFIVAYAASGIAIGVIFVLPKSSQSRRLRADGKNTKAVEDLQDALDKLVKENPELRAAKDPPACQGEEITGPELVSEPPICQGEEQEKGSFYGRMASLLGSLVRRKKQPK